MAKDFWYQLELAMIGERLLDAAPPSMPEQLVRQTVDAEMADSSYVVPLAMVLGMTCEDVLHDNFIIKLKD